MWANVPASSWHRWRQNSMRLLGASQRKRPAIQITGKTDHRTTPCTRPTAVVGWLRSCREPQSSLAGRYERIAKMFYGVQLTDCVGTCADKRVRRGRTETAGQAPNGRSAIGGRVDWWRGSRVEGHKEWEVILADETEGCERERLANTGRYHGVISMSRLMMTAVVAARCTLTLVRSRRSGWSNLHPAGQGRRSSKPGEAGRDWSTNSDRGSIGTSRGRCLVR